MTGKDPYEVLGVGKKADKSTIKKAFRNLSKKLHPDKNLGDKTKAEESFAEVSLAYSILSDERRRGLYDQGVPDDLDEDAEAVKNIATMFHSAIQENFDRLEYVDLVSIVRKNLEKNQVEATKAKKKNLQSREKVERLIKRAGRKTKGKDNILASVFKNVIKEIDQMLTVNDVKMVIIEKALDLIDDFVYDYEDSSKYAPPTLEIGIAQWGVTGTAGSTGG